MKIDYYEALSLMLVYFKITGAITFSWWLVFAPVLLGIVLAGYFSSKIKKYSRQDKLMKLMLMKIEFKIYYWADELSRKTLSWAVFKMNDLHCRNHKRKQASK